MCLLVLIALGPEMAVNSPAQFSLPGDVYEFPMTPNGPQARTRTELDAFGRVMEANTPASIIAAAESFALTYKYSQLMSLVKLRELRAELDADSYEGAISIGREMLSENPRNLEALLLMANILPDFPPQYAGQRESLLREARKDIQAAEQLLRTFHMPEGSSPKEFILSKRRMGASLTEAKGFADLVAGRYRDAIAAYQQALAEGADASSVVALRLGQAYYAAGDLKDARQQFQHAAHSSSSLIRQTAARLLMHGAANQNGRLQSPDKKPEQQAP